MVKEVQRGLRKVKESSASERVKVGKGRSRKIREG